MSIKPGNQHDELTYFSSRDGQLVVAGQPLLDVIAKLGATPLYLYDSRVISTKVSKLRAALPSDVGIHYAIKANPLPEVVQHLRQLTDGVDVASLGELNLALQCRCPPATISFAGPGKRDNELLIAVQRGITINVESEHELAKLIDIANQTRQRPNVAIRVNPNFELKSSGMRMSGGPKPFGIDAEAAPDILHALRTAPVNFLGLHIFSGSQSLQAHAIVEAQNRALDLAIELMPHAPAPLRLLNLGGGFGIPYFPGDRALDLAAVGESMHLLAARSKRLLPTCNLVVELGRYLVGDAGIYVTRILDRKISRGHTFLICDGGLHHHLAASGNFGQVLRKNYPIIIGNKVDLPARETVSIVGPLCTPLDIIADKIELPITDIGDLVVVMQSGAYGRSASPLDFLSHPHPIERLL